MQKPVSYHEQTAPAFTLADVARAALDHVGDQWRAASGPWGTTGHLWAWDNTPFTIGVNGTGELFVRNDRLGDALPLPVTPADDLDTVARAVADITGRLY
ncbi:hypothetical protein AQJ30_15615 [Streptomyces longwoodensis]|uniref:Uncharacterized protein n=1 Tax=Streptomyces longwoodensis TaxID=68231 RepID=A0A101QX26_9ACTN|nr:hypothetical protein [Streptomyces longwoodensis]KUN37710.1 hypothetical protein AQJ30_15615 [Streptomyces longwoodensis]